MPLPRCRIPILTVAGLIEIAALHQPPCRDAVQVAPPRARRERECHLYFARRVTFLSCADMLSAHCQEYGMFGLGFSRETILAWGGNPVFYLPTHPTAGTLE